MGKQINVTAQEAAENYASGLSNSVDKIARGVDRVNEAPGIRAAAKKEKWKAGIDRAYQNGTWARNVARVSVEEWRKAFKEKGLNAISSGAQFAIPKMASFFDQFLPHLQKGMDEVSKMPDLTLEDKIARMTKMVRHNASFRRS